LLSPAPNRIPPGWAPAYRLAVAMAIFFKLNAFAVLAFSAAIARLPSH
jgi:hypothetical protein